MQELAHVHGSFMPIADATVSVEDRGFQFGDAVYEVIVSHAGRPRFIGAHLERLGRSAAAIGLRYDFDAFPLEPIITEGTRRCGFPRAQIYIQLTRGVASRAHAIPDNITPTLVITFKPLGELPDTLRRSGVAVITTPDIRWQQCYIKATTLLPNVLAKSEAIRRGCFDAIFVAENGEVREATSANVFIVKNGCIRIPKRDESILHGVVQGCVIDCAAAAGIALEQTRCDIASLMSADEVFLSSTAIDVLGVTSVDDQRIGAGTPGPITQRLADDFRTHLFGDAACTAVDG